MKKILLPKYIYFEDQFVLNYGIAIDDNKIIKIAPAEVIKELYPEFAQKEYSDTVFVPGTVNTHNHSFQSLLRGIAIDQPFLTWRDNSLYKYSPQMRLEDIYNGALFAYAEMMKCGVTSVCDFFYLHNYGTESDEAVIQAAKDIGIRLVLARTMYDWDGAPNGYLETVDQAVKNTRDLAKKYQNDSMITIIPAPHSLWGQSRNDSGRS